MNQRLEKLNDEIMDCQTCPEDHRYQHELGWGPLGRIMFIGQCPAYSNSTGKQGTSDFDKFLFKLLEATPITAEDFYFTNLVKIPVDINTMTVEELDHCATHVIEEIDIVKPKFIVCLGKYAYSTLKRAGIDVHSVMHPAAIRYGRATEQQWQTEFNNLLAKFKVTNSLGKE